MYLKKTSLHNVSNSLGFIIHITLLIVEIDGIQIELNSDNLLITMNGIEGFAFSGDGEIGVVLNTTMTEELIEEGYLREILSKIQTTRKESGFEVLDRINIFVTGNDELLEKFKKFEDIIKKDTLADNIIYDNQDKDYLDIVINGEDLKLKLEVVK